MSRAGKRRTSPAIRWAQTAGVALVVALLVGCCDLIGQAALHLAGSGR